MCPANLVCFLTAVQEPYLHWVRSWAELSGRGVLCTDEVHGQAAISQSYRINGIHFSFTSISQTILELKAFSTFKNISRYAWCNIHICRRPHYQQPKHYLSGDCKGHQFKSLWVSCPSVSEKLISNSLLLTKDKCATALWFMSTWHWMGLWAEAPNR